MIECYHTHWLVEIHKKSFLKNEDFSDIKASGTYNYHCALKS
jgi:hypothetical protein